MEANKYGYIAVEIVKENFKFQLMLPMGCPWEICEQVLEDYKSEIESMKKIALEQAEKAQAQSVKE